MKSLNDNPRSRLLFAMILLAISADIVQAQFHDPKSEPILTRREIRRLHRQRVPREKPPATFGQIPSPAVVNPARQIDELFTAKDLRRVVSGFDRVEFHILPTPSKEDGDYNAPQRLLARPGPGKQPSAEQSSRLAAIFTSPGSYTFGARYMCGTLYGVRFDFYREDQEVSILVCLSCAEVGVVVHPDKIKRMRSEHLELKQVYPELLAIIQELVPAGHPIKNFKPPSSG